MTGTITGVMAGRLGITNGIDKEMEEIFRLLRENPQDKQLVLKLSRGKRDVKEALEGLEISKPLNEESQKSAFFSYRSALFLPTLLMHRRPSG